MGLERDPIIVEERIMQIPGSPICKRCIAERGENGGAGEEPKERLLSRSAKNTDLGSETSANQRCADA